MRLRILCHNFSLTLSRVLQHPGVEAEPASTQHFVCDKSAVCDSSPRCTVCWAIQFIMLCRRRITLIKDWSHAARADIKWIKTLFFFNLFLLSQSSSIKCSIKTKCVIRHWRPMWAFSDSAGCRTEPLTFYMWMLQKLVLMFILWIILSHGLFLVYVQKLLEIQGTFRWWNRRN